jgi:hypothetical protein
MLVRQQCSGQLNSSGAGEEKSICVGYSHVSYENYHQCEANAVVEMRFEAIVWFFDWFRVFLVKRET